MSQETALSTQIIKSTRKRIKSYFYSRQVLINHRCRREGITTMLLISPKQHSYRLIRNDVVLCTMALSKTTASALDSASGSIISSEALSVNAVVKQPRGQASRSRHWSRSHGFAKGLYCLPSKETVCCIWGCVNWVYILKILTRCGDRKSKLT